jgi:hypothetical protein
VQRETLVSSTAIVDRCTKLLTKQPTSGWSQATTTVTQEAVKQQTRGQKWIMVGDHPPAVADHEKLPKRGSS